MMKLHRSAPLALIVVGFLSICNFSIADEIKIPISSQGSYLGNIERPNLGQKQQQVLDIFGQPAKQYPATGTPAITRWDYENFSVYFENDVVLHSVLRHQRADLLPAKND